MKTSVSPDGCRPRIADAISRQAGFSLQASGQTAERSAIRDRNEQRTENAGAKHFELSSVVEFVALFMFKFLL